MKKLLALLLALVMVLSLAACGKKDKDNDKPDENPATTGSDTISTDEQGRSVVRVGIQAAPTTMAPWEAMSMGGIATRRSIYEFLVDKASFGGEMVGVLMEDYEIVDDTTYNCKIYDYIYDTAGNHLTAEDVVFSYMTAKELGNMGKLSVIESVTAIDKYTAQFKFEKPLGLGDIETLWSEAPVVTKAAYEASGDKMATMPVGTTAYKVSDYVAGASITLEKTGKYWQTDESKLGTYSKANVDIIQYIVISETAQLSMALETGTIDISANITADDIHRFEGVEGYKVSSYVDNLLTVLMPNCSEDSVMSNQALREAVFHAVNAEEILLGVYGGEGVVANSNGSAIYGDANPDWANDEYWTYDVDAAKAKLADAGYKENELTLDLICINTAQIQSAATMLQAYLGQIGIEVKINAFENAMFNTMMQDSTAWDIALNSVASSDYLINLWKLVLSKDNTAWEGTSNFVFNDELQALLAEASTLDGHTQENMDAINDMITENAWFRALFNVNTFIAHTDGIKTVSQDFRNQIMAHCCEYNLANVAGEGDLVDIEEPEPEPSKEPEMQEPEMGAMDKKLNGTYKWSIDPGFGFVMVMTGTFTEDGNYTIDVTGLPNGDLKFAGTYESDGTNIVCGASTLEDKPDAQWGIYEADGTSKWVVTGADSWVPANMYEGPAMDTKLNGTYKWSIDPGFGFVMVMTGTFTEDGNYAIDVTGLPNGDLKFAGTYESNGTNITCGASTLEDKPDAQWGIYETDGTSKWVITGADSWVPANMYEGPESQTLSGTYTWSIDPGFGFVMVMTGTFTEDGNYTIDVTGLPNGNLKFAGTYEYDGTTVTCGASTLEDKPDAQWGIFKEDGTCQWTITGADTWEPVMA